MCKLKIVLMYFLVLKTVKNRSKSKMFENQQFSGCTPKGGWKKIFSAIHTNELTADDTWAPKWTHNSLLAHHLTLVTLPTVVPCCCSFRRAVFQNFCSAKFANMFIMPWVAPRVGVGLVGASGWHVWFVQVKTKDLLLCTMVIFNQN
jgi:hypothetical protein